MADIIGHYFDYDKRNNIYDTVLKFMQTQDDTVWQNLPLFYAEFLNYPDHLDDFLESINTYDIVYEGANILTFLSFAMFHLCKLSHMKGDKFNNTDNYLLYFGKWITRFFRDRAYEHINLYEKVNGFFRPYTYILMMSAFGMDDLDFEKSPLYAFMTGLQRNNVQAFKIDVLDDVIKPLLARSNKDMYKFDIRALYELDGSKSYNMVVDRTDFYTEKHGNMLGFINHRFYEYDVHKIYSYVSPATRSDLKIAICINRWMLSYLYDIDSSGLIVNNNKWQIILRFIWNLLENTDDLEDEILFLGYNLFVSDLQLDGERFPKLFRRSDNGETILYPIMRNKHYVKNSGFVKKLFYAIFRSKYQIISDSGHTGLMINKSMLSYRDENGSDILIFILNRFVRLPVHRVNIQSFESMTYSSPEFWLPKKENDDSSNNSPETRMIKGFFKDIIDGLIKAVLDVIYHKIYDQHKGKVGAEGYNYDFKKYKKEIFLYKNSLMLLGINLDKYPFDKITFFSPNSKKSRRSVDKKMSLSLSSKEKADGYFDNFYDQGLVKKLTKIYIRTVQDCQGTNDYHRLSSITEYLEVKYKKEIDYDGDYLSDRRNHKVTVDNGREFEYLFAYWSTKLYRGNLNVPYIFYYKTGSGIDQSGLTKQVFDNIARQLLEKKIFVRLPDSARYVLNIGVKVELAAFTGQLLALLILHNAHLDFNISMLYLAGMMFRQADLKDEELFLYFLLDLDPGSAKLYKKSCEGEDIGMCDPSEIVGDIVKQRYNLQSPQFKAFADNFFIAGRNKKLFYSSFKAIKDKIRMHDLDKILTVYKLNSISLKYYVFDNLQIVYRTKNEHDIYVDERIDKSDTRTPQIYLWFEEFFLQDDDDTFKAMYEAFDDALIPDPNILLKKAEFLSKHDFCAALLKYWTGTRGPVRPTYCVAINTTIGYMMSHTCSNEIEFPVESERLKSKQALYNDFIEIFVTEQNNTFQTS